MTPSELSFAAAGLLLAGIVKGVTGIGYATCAMPFLVIAVGLEAAMAIVVAPAIASNAAVIACAGGITRTVARFYRFYLAILPGIVCGTLLLRALDPRLATQGLAGLTICYVALAIARPSLALPARLEQPLALPAGFLNGMLTSVTGSQIFPLVPYMMALRLEPQAQVQAINLAVTIASLALGAALLATGIMTPALLVVSAAGVVPAMLGVAGGSLLRDRLPIEAMRRLTLAVLLLIGVGLLARDAIEQAIGLACPPVAHACLGAPPPPQPRAPARFQSLPVTTEG